MKLHLSPRFKRAYKRLPTHIQADFDNKVTLFTENPFHPSLKTHKLHGKLQECFSFRLRDGYRVLFDFSGSESLDLLDVGKHDIYDRH